MKKLFFIFLLLLFSIELYAQSSDVDPQLVGTWKSSEKDINWDEYLPIYRVSAPPNFDNNDIYKDLIFPPIALRSGIEGRVILELFVDKEGVIQQIVILQETPKDCGFGEAAIKAFSGKIGIPAIGQNRESVSSRYRYPVSFRIR